ncbi:MAG: hypothetical protein FJ146_09335 [Deltaproteobacteria bacterium]|nr:hypothetical protein [Deltaproteobacteria bacterium]
MSKFFHILVSLCFLAANVAAAIPACDSEKSAVNCMLAHSSPHEATSVAQKAASVAPGPLDGPDVFDATGCTCIHHDVCLGCCHSHNFTAPSTAANALPASSLPLNDNFGAKSLHSTQPEADINRPPIASV